jgi:hypothetical protein
MTFSFVEDTRTRIHDIENSQNKGKKARLAHFVFDFQLLILPLLWLLIKLHKIM